MTDTLNDPGNVFPTMDFTDQVMAGELIDRLGDPDSNRAMVVETGEVAQGFYPTTVDLIPGGQADRVQMTGRIVTLDTMRDFAAGADIPVGAGEPATVAADIPHGPGRGARFLNRLLGLGNPTDPRRVMVERSITIGGEVTTPQDS